MSIQTTLIQFNGRSKYLTTEFFAKVCVNTGGYIGLSNILKLDETLFKKAQVPIYCSMSCLLKTFQVASLFLWTFVLVLVRRMTAAAAAATAAVTGCAMQKRLSTSKVFTAHYIFHYNHNQVQEVEVLH